MWLDKFLSFLVPKDKKFFDLFTQAAKNLVEISRALTEFINADSYEQRQVIFKKIQDLEHVGDDITHKVMLELSINFITPFDREDIHYLATTLDDVADNIQGAAKRILLYRVEVITPPMKDIVALIDKCTKEVDYAVSNLQHLSHPAKIKEAIIRIKDYEDKANDVLHPAIADLFENEKDATRLIKHQEVLNVLENATDMCDDVANVIESILVKSS